MGFTAENELEIRRALAQKAVSGSVFSGVILPSPMMHVDRADFFATVDPLVTQKQIETTPIAFGVLTLLGFEDSPAEGCGDEPLIRLTYNFYFFREYEATRADEGDPPDEFLKKNLNSYNLFIQTILEERQEFLGLQNLSVTDDSMDVKTNSLKQEEFIGEAEICRYIPRVKGHSVDLQCEVQILINEV